MRYETLVEYPSLPFLPNNNGYINYHNFPKKVFQTMLTGGFFETKIKDSSRLSIGVRPGTRTTALLRYSILPYLGTLFYYALQFIIFQKYKPKISPTHQINIYLLKIYLSINKFSFIPI